jgi:signal transduction histidine kinase
MIDDDGRGFPFSGRLGSEELEASHLGPTIIKERLRAIGGALAIESRPGRGSSLEITVPGKPHA